MITFDAFLDSLLFSYLSTESMSIFFSTLSLFSRGFSSRLSELKKKYNLTILIFLFVSNYYIITVKLEEIFSLLETESNRIKRVRFDRNRTRKSIEICGKVWIQFDSFLFTRKFLECHYRDFMGIFKIYLNIFISIDFSSVFGYFMELSRPLLVSNFKTTNFN